MADSDEVASYRTDRKLSPLRIEKALPSVGIKPIDLSIPKQVAKSVPAPVPVNEGK